MTAYPVFSVPTMGFRTNRIVVGSITNDFYSLAMPTEVQIRASTNNFTTICYGWCSDGTNGTTWAEDWSDHDAKMFFSSQSNTMNLVEWDETKFLSAQLDPVGSPGMQVIFQPSLVTADEITNTWMTAGNTNLIWVYTLQTAYGNIAHPDGAQMWSGIIPTEWRKERIML